MITAKSPRGGQDIIQASANNFYSPALSLAGPQEFHEHYPLNSRVVEGADGNLVEQVYRAGTPDGKVPPGLYAQLPEEGERMRWKRRAPMPSRRRPR